MNVWVSFHALERWRQRVPGRPGHADAVREALAEAEHLGRSAALPFARMPRRSYRYHKDLGVYFVLANAADRLELLTVLDQHGPPA